MLCTEIFQSKSELSLNFIMLIKGAVVQQTLCIGPIDIGKYNAIISLSYLAMAVREGLCSDRAIPLRVRTAPVYHR